MVNPLAENGKENMPNPPPAHHHHHPEAAPSPNAKVAVATKSGKVAPDKSKRRKGDTIPHTAPAHTNSTDREFDRLLVRACVVC